MYRWHRSLQCVLKSLVALSLLSPLAAQGQGVPLLKDGDRVVLVGGTFIERMQTHGYLETELATRLHAKNLTFRNLGWSGDNVFGESRAVFGTIPDGYARLLRDLKLASPSVVVVHYGVVEAGQGASGLPDFQKALSRLADDIAKLDARMILLLPRPQLEMGPPFPNATSFNKVLGLYRDSIRSFSDNSPAIAVELSVLGGRLSPPQALSSRRTPFRNGPSLDGIQLTADGYWRQAPSLAASFSGPREKVQIRLDIQKQEATATGGSLKLLASEVDKVRLEFRANSLPRLRPPGMATGDGPLADMTLTIKSLLPGRYEIAVGEGIAGDTSYTSRQLASGIVLPTPSGDQVVKLQAAIARKNELFFHRYRPQNETYLLLFRKHEQGNNAAEIPMFDPLVEALDREIHRLARPPLWQVTIRQRPTR
jgi:lysophospholipase L1-like esterase